MKKIIAITALFLSGNFVLKAQVFKSKKDEVKVTFFSTTPIEDISAVHSTSTSVIVNDSIKFSLSNTGFVFPKPLMQEHFNENYMESPKYPKSTFKGKIENVSSIQLGKDGSYPVVIKGTLDMHGVSKPVTANATFVVKGGAISATSKLKVLLADYNISVPAVVKDNIAKEVEISISADYSIFK